MGLELSTRSLKYFRDLAKNGESGYVSIGTDSEQARAQAENRIGLNMLGDGDILNEYLGAQNLKQLQKLPAEMRLDLFRSSMSPSPLVVDDGDFDRLPVFYSLVGPIRSGFYSYVLSLIDLSDSYWFTYLTLQPEDTGDPINPHAQIAGGQGSSKVLRAGKVEIGNDFVREIRLGANIDKSNWLLNGKNKLSMEITLDTHFQGYRQYLLDK
ncbi:MAG TPA: hypothetical protein VHE53_04645 [Patescibacteria group bacterium]|nr:hypothetical protein [Patescibacteria group bacterium]